MNSENENNFSVGTLVTTPITEWLHGIVISRQRAPSIVTVKLISSQNNTSFPGQLMCSLPNNEFQKTTIVKFHTSQLIYTADSVEQNIKASYLCTALHYTEDNDSLDAGTAYEMLQTVERTMGGMTDLVMKYHLCFFLCKRAREAGLYREAAEHLEPCLSDGTPFNQNTDRALAEYTVASAWIACGEFAMAFRAARNIFSQLTRGESGTIGNYGKRLTREMAHKVKDILPPAGNP